MSQKEVLPIQPVVSFELQKFKDQNYRVDILSRAVNMLLPEDSPEQIACFFKDIASENKLETLDGVDRQTSRKIETAKEVLLEKWVDTGENQRLTVAAHDEEGLVTRQEIGFVASGESYSEFLTDGFLEYYWSKGEDSKYKVFVYSNDCFLDLSEAAADNTDLFDSLDQSGKKIEEVVIINVDRRERGALTYMPAPNCRQIYKYSLETNSCWDPMSERVDKTAIRGGTRYSTSLRYPDDPSQIHMVTLDTFDLGSFKKKRWLTLEADPTFDLLQQKPRFYADERISPFDNTRVVRQLERIGNEIQYTTIEEFERADSMLEQLSKEERFLLLLLDIPVSSLIGKYIDTYNQEYFLITDDCQRIITKPVDSEVRKMKHVISSIFLYHMANVINLQSDIIIETQDVRELVKALMKADEKSMNSVLDAMTDTTVTNSIF